MMRELGAKGDYSTWAKRQNERGHLIENRDVFIFVVHDVNSGRGRPSIEYYFSLDAAKHIAMMSGTEKGRFVREYFIAAEKELTSKNPGRPKGNTNAAKHALLSEEPQGKLLPDEGEEKTIHNNIPLPSPHQVPIA
jgi:phage anti-repressor protein